jgi:O-antigen/teichoic acid export membrane protein
LGLVVQAALARWLGVSGYGLVSTVIALTTVLAVVGTWGTNGSALRYVPHFEVLEDKKAATRFVGFSLTTTLLVSTVVGVAFVVVAVGTGSTLTVLDAVAAAILTMFTALQLVGTSLGQLAKRFTVAWGSQLIVRPIIIVALVVVAVAAKVHASGGLAIIFLSVGAAAGFVLQLDAVRRGFGWAGLKLVAPKREWFMGSPSYLIITAFQLILAQIDLLAVSVFLTRASIGYYSAALKTSAVLTLPFVAVLAVIKPRISTFASGGTSDTDALRLLTHATLWCGLSTAALALPLILWPGIVLKIFGASFVHARFALQMVAIGNVALAFTGCGGTLLIYMDRRRVAIAAAAIATGLSAVMCGAGAVVDGINGAAVAGAAADLLAGIICYALSWRYAGIRVSCVEALVPRWRQTSIPGLRTGRYATVLAPAGEEGSAFTVAEGLESQASSAAAPR